jgi:type III secretory pathway component EscV
LELGTGLAEQAGPQSRLLREYLPEMRTRIRDDLGVVVPGIRVRDSRAARELGQSFIIMLNEIPQVSGRVRTGWRYAPYSPQRLAAFQIPEAAQQEAANGGNSSFGCWIDPPNWERVTAAGLELWPDVHYFVVRQLEEVLRRNLTDFIDIQYLDNLLVEWRKEQTLASDISITLPDQASHLRFVRLLQQLARERVPITNVKEILQGLRASPLIKHDISESLIAVRLRLRDQLPGNQPQFIRLEVPPAVESKILSSIHDEGGKSFLAILPEDTRQLLTEIREIPGIQGRQCVLVTRDARTRPLLRRLIEIEFPDQMVIAQEELLTVEAREVAASGALTTLSSTSEAHERTANG